MRHLLIILILFASCKTPEKLFGKVLGEKPGIVADHCARTYPCKEGHVRSDTVTVYDTLWGQPEIQVLIDTVKINDTIRITKTVQPPVKTIFKTVTIRDTIKVQNTAALDACMIERKKETERANDEQKQKEKFRSQRNKLRWILAGIGGLGLLWLFLFIRRKVKT